MSDTPFDDDINGLALESILRALDRAINRKNDLENAEPCNGEDLKRLMVEERERRERVEQQVLVDDIRLRKYN